MTNFPTNNNQVFGDNGSPILGGSVGLNECLLFFRKNATVLHHPIWDVYLINIFTLTRNNYKPEITQTDINAKIDLDSDLLTTYIEAYHSATYQAPKPLIIFYAPLYRLPEKLRRQHKGRSLELDQIYAKNYTQYPAKLTDISSSSESTRFLLRVGNSTYPHLELAALLRNGVGGVKNLHQKRAILFSHYLIDLHLTKKVSNLSLLESYTGIIRTPKTFGYRLTKDDNVPFNLYTHRLFGDEELLLPLVQREEKKKALLLAEDKKWKLKTETEILSDIKRYLEIPEELLTNLKF